MSQYGFYIDSKNCTGCKTCQLACKDKHGLGDDISWRRVYSIEGGDWKEEDGCYTDLPFGYFLSVSCNHCEDPSCVQACPTQAMHKQADGLVTIDHTLCMGCRYCEWACPYDAPQYHPQLGKMTKCTFCADYLEEGKNPACVDACPMRAIHYGPLDEIRKRFGEEAEVFPLPAKDYTHPALTVEAHPNAAKANEKTAEVTNKEEF